MSAVLASSGQFPIGSLIDATARRLPARHSGMAAAYNAPSQVQYSRANCVGKLFDDFSRRWVFHHHRHDDLAKFFWFARDLWKCPRSILHISVNSPGSCAWDSFRRPRAAFLKMLRYSEQAFAEIKIPIYARMASRIGRGMSGVAYPALGQWIRRNQSDIEKPCHRLVFDWALLRKTLQR